MHVNIEKTFWIMLFVHQLPSCKGNIHVFKAFKRTHLEDKTLSTRSLWVYNDTESNVRCASQCYHDGVCVSYFYNKGTMTCKGHAMTLGLANDSVVETGNKYYVLQEGKLYS